MKKSRIAVFLMIVICAAAFSGCMSVDQIKVKMGLKNNDFEYISDTKVEKIVIQSTRDSGFRCVVSDKNTINDIHDILASAKKVTETSSMDPDYIFEIYDWGEEPRKFNYVVGAEDKNSGNFYNEDGAYYVSKRIDNDIIKNFSVLRKPRNFSILYYDMMLDFINKYKGEFNEGQKIGINIEDDREVAKYVLSKDIAGFKSELSSDLPNAELTDNNDNDFDTVIKIKTYGYKEKVYKCIITLKDNRTNDETKYYALCQIEDNTWNIDISDTKQDEF